MKPESKRLAVFQPEFLEDLSYWVDTERRTGERLLELVKASLRDPFNGIGHPEPLKYLGADVGSRRITQEHRCVQASGPGLATQHPLCTSPENRMDKRSTGGCG